MSTTASSTGREPRSGGWIPLLATSAALGLLTAAATARTPAGEPIDAGGLPGDLAIFHPEARPLAIGRVDGVAAPVAAAATYGRGRVVVIAHGSFLGAEGISNPATAAFVERAVIWAGGGSDDLSAASRRGEEPLAVRVIGAAAAAEQLAAVETLLVAESDSLDPTAGDVKPRVLVFDTHRLAAADLEPLQQFVRDGGGLVVTGLGWGWQQINERRGLDLRTDHPGSRLLEPMGIAFGAGYNRRFDGGYRLVNEPDAPETRALVAPAAVEMLIRALGPGDQPDAPPGANAGSNDGEPAALAIASASVVRTVRSLPPGHEWTLRHIDRLGEAYRAGAGGEPVPTREQPLGLDDARGLLGRALLAADLDRLAHLPTDEVEPHPAAEAFPGEVPEEAERITRRVAANPSRPGWQSTGLYAPPGEVIRLSSTAGVDIDGWRIRIGCHSDRLWHRDEWWRVPEITLEVPLSGRRHEVASPFGGPVYLIAPRGSDNATGSEPVEVEIAGAVAMPRFVSGETSLDEWRDEIRRLPAPWAEIETSKIIVTVPSDRIRALDDPQRLCDAWDRIADSQADLATIPRERARPERFVADVQISAGYMHAGYPIKTHLDAAERMVDADLLLNRGDWGLFHELGHNHQNYDWTFEGTVEVTVNLFTLYTYHTIVGNQQPRDGLYGEDRAQRIRRHLAGGASFDEWKRDPFLALLMYMQLQEEFGWEAYKAVFAEYLSLPAEERPRTDDEKRDQWLVRMSQQTGRDLGPFFEAWGVPTSAEARQEVAHLPAWMPQDWPAD